MNVIKVEKCRLEEEYEKKPVAFLRQDLLRKVYKISFGIRYFYNDGTVKEEYYDSIYRENLQDGSTYYPNENCNSYEEIGDTSHVAQKRDSLYDEICQKIGDDK